MGKQNFYVFTHGILVCRLKRFPENVCLMVNLMPKKTNVKSAFKLQDYNRELAKVKKEHPRLPGFYAGVVASDHMKIGKRKRD
jgi:hypothetical protein